MFVDNSGRRSKLLRRVGLLLGVGCLAYAAVLGAAFMGWGTSLTPSSLLPFGADGRPGQGPGNGVRPNGGVGNQVGAPGGTPRTALPTDIPSPSVSASAN